MPASSGPDPRARVVEAYRALHGSDPQWVAWGPGRANVIGEHTDYNGGLVLPFAVERGVATAIGRQRGGMVEVRALDFDATWAAPLPSAERPLPIADDWSGYVAGLVNELVVAGHAVEGFRAVVAGDLPIGSGLSSSAAFEVSLVQAMGALFDLGLEPWAQVLTCQAAENRWFGVQSGVMDPFASVFGAPGAALLLDNASRAWQAVDVSLPGVDWIVLDSGVPRRLAASGYNDRRASCEAALGRLRQAGFELTTLSDLRPAHLDRALALLGPVEARRVRHVVSENQRVLAMIGALRAQRVDWVGALLDAGHASLRDDYEVSVPPLEVLIDLVRGLPQVLGARVMGAGFGGSVIVAAREGGAEGLVDAVGGAYASQTGARLAAFVVRPSRGAHVDPVG